MDLFLFYLGGSARKSNIEVHDVQFAVATRPEEAWPELRKAWFGDRNKVHIDGYARLRWADGYRIRLRAEPASEGPRLFFVNVGAYRPETLAEQHDFDLFVAASPAGAKQRALASLLTAGQQQHKDNLKDVDDCLPLERVGGYHIHLEPDAGGRHFQPEWQGYQPIGEADQAVAGAS